MTGINGTANGVAHDDSQYFDDAEDLSVPPHSTQAEEAVLGSVPYRAIAQPSRQALSGGTLANSPVSLRPAATSACHIAFTTISRAVVSRHSAFAGWRAIWSVSSQS
jgi:hypothetical protein